MARILIIDDSPTDTRVFSSVLEKNGFTVLAADSAEAGIEAARRELPDLIVMDVILPGMNGFQATRALSRDAATQHIPIIIVSTKNMETDRVWGLRQGAKDYLVKPPSERELVNRINALLPQGVAGTS
jgi:twitching motility two-component system response regulator PilH